MCAVCTHPWVQFSCIHRLHSGNYKTALQPSFSSHSLVIPHPKIPCIITLEHFAKIYLASTFHFGNWAHSVWNVAALCVCVCAEIASANVLGPPSHRIYTAVANGIRRTFRVCRTRAVHGIVSYIYCVLHDRRGSHRLACRCCWCTLHTFHENRAKQEKKRIKNVKLMVSQASAGCFNRRDDFDRIHVFFLLLISYI